MESDIICQDCWGLLEGDEVCLRCKSKEQAVEIERLRETLADTQHTLTLRRGELEHMSKIIAELRAQRNEIERLQHYETECQKASALLQEHIGYAVGLRQVAAGVKALIAALESDEEVDDAE